MSKLAEREDGIGGVFVVAIIVVVLAVAGLAIWQLTKKSPSTNSSSSNSSTSSSTSSAPSACVKAFNSNSFCDFAGHTNISSQQYVATGTSTSGTGTTSTYTVDNDGKGNTEISYSANGQQISAVTLDGTTYIQSGVGTTWLEYSGGSLSSAVSVPNPVSGFNLNFTGNIPKGVSVNNEGTVACGSLSCYKYKVNVASTPNATQYVYFDATNYLLRQWMFSDSSTNTSVNLTFSYQSVTIAKPSPVQQIST